MTTRLFPVLLVVAVSCGPASRSYEVIVEHEQICRHFDPQPESCAFTQGPALRMNVTVEDRGGGKAILYGRSDSSSERVYMADVPRSRRYEVTEEIVEKNAQTGCETRTRLVVALDVDNGGLEGGEESRTEEDRRCNTTNQHRVTRHLRDWRGSRN